MNRTILVAPSLLSADPLRFGEEIKSIERAGADWHHVDVMDGHFVPNLTFGIPLVSALKRQSSLPLDVHIMVSNPDEVALDYVQAGADIVVFHVEVAKHAHRLAQAIRAKGAKAGIALNPGTPIESAFPLLNEVDIVMLMSVNPGFGGQKFIHHTLDRVSCLSKEIHRRGCQDSVMIEVDGGINLTTASQVVEAGAQVLVAGTFIYGAPDRREAVKQLKELKAS
jgi:ribulose-phosphate 3-epimerase